MCLYGISTARSFSHMNHKYIIITRTLSFYFLFLFRFFVSHWKMPIRVFMVSCRFLPFASPILWCVNVCVCFNNNQQEKCVKCRGGKTVTMSLVTHKIFQCTSKQNHQFESTEMYQFEKFSHKPVRVCSTVHTLYIAMCSVRCTNNTSTTRNWMMDIGSAQTLTGIRLE